MKSAVDAMTGMGQKPCFDPCFSHQKHLELMFIPRKMVVIADRYGFIAIFISYDIMTRHLLVYTLIFVESPQLYIHRFTAVHSSVQRVQRVFLSPASELRSMAAPVANLTCTVCDH